MHPLLVLIAALFGKIGTILTEITPKESFHHVDSLESWQLEEEHDEKQWKEPDIMNEF